MDIDNLPKRQRELNNRVREALTKNVEYEKIKSLPEISDVDKLFKIDYASKIKNIDYIFDILKSGDSLYISRALKSIWLVNDEYAHFVNPDHLHRNLFPFMSIRMKKKMLSVLASNLKNQNRAADFHMYCQNHGLKDLGIKFLFFTSYEYKLRFMEEFDIDQCDIKNFIANSFELLEAYLRSNKMDKSLILYDFCYLYSISDVKYLDIFEKYATYTYERYVNNTYRHYLGYYLKKWGLRITKHVVQNHKKRILSNAALYIPILNDKILIKYSTLEDAKTYAVNLLPSNVQEFWYSDYCTVYKYILDLIPIAEKFSFMKKIYSDKYSYADFEINNLFPYKNYYNLMTAEEKEEWALRNIPANLFEPWGNGNEYIWYKFVNFEMTFKEITKLILVTLDQNKRADMLKIIAVTTKSHQDVEKLLNYYFLRHINEKNQVLEQILIVVLDQHDAYEFRDGCWNILNKLFYKLGVYSDPLKENRFKIFTLMYHIIMNLKLPEVFIEYLDHCDIQESVYRFQNEYIKLNEERRKYTYNFLEKYYLEKLEALDKQAYNDSVKLQARLYILNIITLMDINKTSLHDCPEIIKKLAILDEELQHHFIKQDETKESCTQNKLLRLLKKDIKLYIDELPELYQGRDLKLNIVHKKVRVYFFNDFAKECTNFFVKLLDVYDPVTSYSNNISVACYAIFQLNSVEFLGDFMQKYIPTQTKIEYDQIDKKILLIQECICRFALYARPPVPLEILLKFLKGDYIHFCLPIFNSYHSNLTPTLCSEFVLAIIDAPLSLQKHGIRLAFKNFSPDDLGRVIMDAWNKTKNVTLRSVLYQNLFEKIVHDLKYTHLFKIFKYFIRHLHKDDDESIFTHLNICKLPEAIRGEYLEEFWTVLGKFPNECRTYKWRRNILNEIQKNLSLVNRDFIKNITMRHIQEMLGERNITSVPTQDEVNSINELKWQIVAFDILDYGNNEHLNKNLELLQTILDKCLDMWDEIVNNIYVIRKFLDDFIETLEHVFNTNNIYMSPEPIYERTLNTIKIRLPICEIYMTIWRLRLASLVAKCKHIYRDNKDEYEPYKMYGNGLGKLIKEYVNQRNYFNPKLGLLNLVFENIDYMSYNVSISNVYKKICVAQALTEFDLKEAYDIAIEIMPENVPDESYRELYSGVIQKMTEFNNDEFQFHMKVKFFNYKVNMYC